MTTIPLPPVPALIISHINFDIGVVFSTLCYTNPSHMIQVSTASQSLAFNVFAHSDLGLDTLQSRVFTHLLENITSFDRPQTIHVRIEDVLGTNPGLQHITLLSDALCGLSGKQLTRPGHNRRSMGFYPLFQFICLSDEKGGYVEALFSEHVMVDLRELTSKFSLKEIASFVMLRHSHSQRMFWFLRAFVNERKVGVSVDEIKEVVLGVRKYRQKDAEYERYYDFKTRVLDQAIKTIRDRGLLDIRYREYRHKRVVVKLVFRVSYCAPQDSASKGTQQLAFF